MYFGTFWYVCYILTHLRLTHLIYPSATCARSFFERLGFDQRSLSKPLSFKTGSRANCVNNWGTKALNSARYLHKTYEKYSNNSLNISKRYPRYTQNRGLPLGILWISWISWIYLVMSNLYTRWPDGRRHYSDAAIYFHANAEIVP